jgi:2-dehydropantoate 2-reductase
VLGARVIFGAEIVAPGHARDRVRRPGADREPRRDRRGARAAADRWAMALAAAGIPAEPTADLPAELWGKALYNAALNPLGALLGARYGELPAYPDTRAIMDTVIEEAFAVARAEGVALRWPDAVAYRDAFYGRLVPATAEHRSSMLQDIERGRPTEIDAINGQIAARGPRAACPRR